MIKTPIFLTVANKSRRYGCGLSPHGYSLLEVLISFGIITVLLLFSLPLYKAYRERSDSQRCITNLRQLGAATMQFAGEHRQELPYYYNISDGKMGSGSVTGTWFYNLAPYVGVPRVEVHESGPRTSKRERLRLGTTIEDGLAGPCVFTCPSHGPDESSYYWKPHPGSYPTNVPVSYAPSAKILRKVGDIPPVGMFTFPLRLSEIVDPSRKGWLMDSPSCRLLDMGSKYWSEERGDPSEKGNSSRQAFTRHYNGGNVLFFDGHVEWIPLTTFTEPEDGSLNRIVNRYFDPYVPASD